MSLGEVQGLLVVSLFLLLLISGVMIYSILITPGRGSTSHSGELGETQCPRYPFLLVPVSFLAIPVILSSGLMMYGLFIDEGVYGLATIILFILILIIVVEAFLFFLIPVYAIKALFPQFVLPRMDLLTLLLVAYTVHGVASVVTLYSLHHGESCLVVPGLTLLTIISTAAILSHLVALATQ